MMIDLLHGDCRDVLRTLADNSIDSIVTDPPYELGFMGKSWDASGIAYDITVWQECLRVLKPGGHLLAFGGSRTYHRLAVAIEDAGFQIRDQIMWVYGSGFPKSLNISKAIDKAAGAEREVIGLGQFSDRGRVKSRAVLNLGVGDSTNSLITAPATAEAKEWDGWGTALKPAHEPIVLARKPLVGTVANNVLTYGVGGINIDGCRVETEDSLFRRSSVAQPENNTLHEGWRRPWQNDIEKVREANLQTQEKSAIADELGRWPANFIHDGSDEVLELFPDSKAGKTRSDRGTGGIWSASSGVPCGDQYGDSGSAARFFYCAKASKKDRNEGLDEFPLVKGGSMNGAETRPDRPTNHPIRANHHPTVKPTDLMRYLCRLVTPPNGTVLDPFTGSGSTGKAAVLEGFNFIGIEQSAEYVEIAKARIEAAK